MQGLGGELMEASLPLFGEVVFQKVTCELVIAPITILTTFIAVPRNVTLSEDLCLNVSTFATPTSPPGR